MFLSLYSLYFLKGFLQSKGQVVFFDKNIQKISTLLPLYYGIWRELVCLQAEQTKNKDLVARLGLAIIPAEPPVLSFCRFGQNPRCFFPCKAWIGEAKEPRRARPNEIWYNVLDHIL